MIKIAIDPGVSGGVALDDDGVVSALNCPGNGALVDMVDYVMEFKGKDVRVLLEQVAPMPKEGVNSVWTFSGNYHIWKCALYFARLPTTDVIPGKWMRFVGSLPADKDTRKKVLKQYSARRYPHLKVTFATADALAMLSVFDSCWDKLVAPKKIDAPLISLAL